MLDTGAANNKGVKIYRIFIIRDRLIREAGINGKEKVPTYLRENVKKRVLSTRI